MDATLNQDLSLLHLITHASFVVQLILGILALVSFFSWWQIFDKFFLLRQTLKQTLQFERKFWSGADLNTLYQTMQNKRIEVMGLEKIFESGFREFLKLKRQTGLDIQHIMEGVRRAMRADYQRELDRLEEHLAFLATTGSVSPYVGLLGTVWGIMNAFRGLANVGQATLAHVAPGIAEALIATAMGLFAAIPAVVAYNRYTHEVDRLASRFESFIEEFSNILQRQTLK